MSVKPTNILDMPDTMFAGIDRSYTFKKMGEIPGQWHVFGPHLGSIPYQSGPVAYGICHEMDDQGFRYLACTSITELGILPEDFVTMSLPGAKYAVFEHSGHVSTLCDTIDAIWSSGLKECECEAIEKPWMIERYGEGFCPELGCGDITVWIPIKG